MQGYGIEIIISRQLADCLNVPVFIVDPVGTLLFYNEAAEAILGKRFEDTGTMAVNDWATIFTPYDGLGNELPPEDLPLVETINTHAPSHGTFWIKSLNGNSYNISVTSFPIIGRSNEFSGAIAIFWVKKNAQ